MAYNLQTVVDSKHKLIVDFDITQNTADQGNLNSMSQKDWWDISNFVCL